MGHSIHKIQYNCWDDCRPQGCPGHEAILEFNSVSMYYHFTINGQELYFDDGQMEAMIKLLKAVGGHTDHLFHSPIN